MSNFIKVINKGLPNTVVVFSSVNVPEGKFSAIHALGSLDANLIFINCPNNNWYIKEIPGLGLNIDEIAFSLIKHLKNLGNEKVIFYGGSMGAYGALLYAAKCHANYSLVTGVEAKLGSPRGYYNNLCNDKVPPEDFPNLIETISKSNVQSDILVGEACFSDHGLVKGLTNLKNITVRTIKNGGHRIPPYIEQKIGLAKLLSQSITSNDINENFSFTTKLLTECDVYDLIEKCVLKMPLSDDKYTELFNYANDEANSAHYRSYAYYAISLQVKNQCDVAKNLEKAIELNPDNYLFHDSITTCLSNKNLYQQAIKYAQKTCEIIKYSGFESFEYYALKLVNLYIKEKNIEAAMLLLLEIKKTIPAKGKMRDEFNILEQKYLLN
ncbi:hypothetical protein [Paraglaciecola sp.]|uniref:hypothetical protein n=1 Tax=Paraglaciecola sp. TaxID=1920173 RepID=UPI0032663BE5